MSKLAKMQEAKLEKLRLLSSAGRNQLEEALEQQKPSADVTPGAEPDPVPPPAVLQPPKERRSAASKPAIRTKRIGRPPLGPDMRASTVYLPEAWLRSLNWRHWPARAGRRDSNGLASAKL